MAPTRRAAIEKAEELTNQRKKGLDTQAAKTTLSAFFARFLDFYKTEGGVSLRTWQDYRDHVDKNVAPYLGGIAVGDLKPRDVDQWSKSLRERGLGDRTIEYALAVLRRILQFAVEWEIIDRNPAGARFRATKRKRTVKSGGPRIRFFDPESARVFLNAIRGDRHEALYALAITTGLRPEELYGLRNKDVDLKNRKLNGQSSSREDASSQRGDRQAL